MGKLKQAKAKLLYKAYEVTCPFCQVTLYTPDGESTFETMFGFDETIRCHKCGLTSQLPKAVRK